MTKKQKTSKLSDIIRQINMALCQCQAQDECDQALEHYIQEVVKDVCNRIGIADIGQYIRMREVKEDYDIFELSNCQSCWCMTHSTGGKCSKCGEDK